LASSSFVTAFAAMNNPQNMASYVAAAFSPATLAEELTDVNSTFFLAEHASILAGYAKLRRGEPGAAVTGPKPVELQRIYTASDLIGTGVGGRLLAAAAETARQEGYQTLWLGVWEQNPPSIAFYERKGFIAVGQHEFLLGEEQQTDLIMQLNLTG
jgi:GNAT superfamily N-acetyltransferase